MLFLAALSIEWTVGPVPINDNIGKEVISKFTSNLHTGTQLPTSTSLRSDRPTLFFSSYTGPLTAGRMSIDY
jgi:hypothetical protein